MEIRVIEGHSVNNEYFLNFSATLFLKVFKTGLSTLDSNTRSVERTTLYGN